ncbi:MAG: phosphopentomutase [Oscillospiraceae bacterium]|nr:phosphopentomutase [Oscillospiraceae bacterium]
MAKRVFLIVLDSCGCGELPDAADYGDAGSHTIRALVETGRLHVPNLTKMGLFNIDGIGCGTPVEAPTAAYGKCAERSRGKDTTTGHWEIAGLISTVPMRTFPDGFPEEVLSRLRKATGREILCNLPYSGTEVIRDYGREHMETGALIVYTSADSVLQIAAHESVIPVDELYEICRKAREIMQGEFAVGRIIARPFVGEYPNFTRTANRHDFSVSPFAPTLLDLLKDAGRDVISVGKIVDIFNQQGITEAIRTKSNDDGMGRTITLAGSRDFNGFCFVNLVEFDSSYGHRNDVPGYTAALNAFDAQLGALLPLLHDDDLLMITADHGCDPSTPSTDHSREYIPLLVWGKGVQPVNLGVRTGFSDIGQTVADALGVSAQTLAGSSFAREIGAIPS